MNIQSIEVIKHENNYSIFCDGKPFLTPKRNEINYHDSRLLEHIVREISVEKVKNLTQIRSYLLLSGFIDNKTVDQIDDSVFIKDAIEKDQLILRIIGSPDDNKNANLSLIDLISELNKSMPFIFTGVAEVTRCLNEYLMHEGLGSLIAVKKSFSDFEKFIIEKYLELIPEKKSVLRNLYDDHKSGIILPLLLVLGVITPSEYTNTLFVIQIPRNITNNGGGSSLDLKSDYLIDWKNPTDSYNILHSDILKVYEYLSYFRDDKKEKSDILKLIKAGEGYNLEFKSTLRWNIKASKKDPAIEHASLKTINAFLNSAGGKLLIGVEDNGSIIGIDLDGFANEDKFSLHFWDLIKSSMGEDLGPFITTSFEKMDNKTFFIVDCQKSPRPVFLNQKGFNEEFYIRTGPGSTSLTIQDALKYIEFRFK